MEKSLKDDENLENLETQSENDESDKEEITTRDYDHQSCGI